MSDDIEVDVYVASNAYNFMPGMCVELTMSADGQLRPMTAWERLVSRIKRRLARATRWWRPRTVVSRVEVADGVVSLSRECWSWRRWRWE